MPGSDADHHLQQLLERYGHVLRRAIARAAPRGGGVDLDDVEQEARLRVWNALQRRVEVRSPASYLYRVAWSATVDAVRRVRARREADLPGEADPPAGDATPGPRLVAPGASPEDRAVQRQEVRRVEAALGRLSANRRRAVGLYLQGFSSTEIGRLLGWSEAKARNLAYRGLADLRRELEAEDDDEGAGLRRPRKEAP